MMMHHELLSQLLRLSAALTIALLLVLLVRRIFARTLHPHLRYALWLAVPLAMLCVFVPKPSAGATEALLLPATSIALVQDRVLPTAQALELAWRTPLFALWLSGVIAMSLVLAWRYSAAHLAARVIVKDACLVGIWRPVLKLPADFTQRFNPIQQRMIVAHEHFHARRFDPAVNFLTQLLHCVFWFHPVLPMAMRAFRDDQEMSCDAAIVARHPAELRSYAEALAACANDRSDPSLWCQWRPTHPLLERITMLKQMQHRTFKPQRSALLLGLTLMLSSWLSFAAAGKQALGESHWIAADIARDGARLSLVAIHIEAGQPGTIAIGRQNDGTQARAALSIELQASRHDSHTKLAVRSELAASQGSGSYVENTTLSVAPDQPARYRLTHPETKQVYDITLASTPAHAMQQDPKTLVQQSPEYPVAAMMLGISGKVLLRVALDASGMVQATEVLASEPAGVFDRAAIAQAKQRSYPSALLPQGTDLAWVQVPFQYQLEN
jgi:bla regulator protein blaR1